MQLSDPQTLAVVAFFIHLPFLTILIQFCGGLLFIKAGRLFFYSIVLTFAFTSFLNIGLTTFFSQSLVILLAYQCWVFISLLKIFLPLKYFPLHSCHIIALFYAPIVTAFVSIKLFRQNQRKRSNIDLYQERLWNRFTRC